MDNASEGDRPASETSTLLDPVERSERGARLQARLTGRSSPQATSLHAASWRDYVYAEVWTRDGLDLRSRLLISIATAACVRDQSATADYVRAALAGDFATVAELREAALHLAVYGGWSAGGVVDDAVNEAVAALSMEEPAVPPIRATEWRRDERIAEGQASFQRNMLFPSPPARTAYFEAGIVNFVFGEMWNRPGLDQRARRWVTLVGVGMSSSSTPVRSHVWSALASGNASTEEMFEFVLQYAVHAGWPRGSVMQAAVTEQARHVSQNQDYQGAARG